jgi:hypothetical protein
MEASQGPNWCCSAKGEKYEGNEGNEQKIPSLIYNKLPNITKAYGETELKFHTFLVRMLYRHRFDAP